MFKRLMFILVIAVLVFLTLPMAACQLQRIPASPSLTPTPSPIMPGSSVPQSQNQAPPLPSIADVVAVAKPSVVAINTEFVTLGIFNQPTTERGAGSGWIIDAQGIIVTNNHVVEGAKTISVTL